jgi:retinol dehydrogenase-12
MTADAMQDLAGRRCVITGATRGIGLAAAEALAARGASLVLVGRDASRLATAGAAAHRAARGGTAPVTILADLATGAGVQHVVASLARDGTPIDVLYNNAGAIFPARALTQDGIERTFALNHLAPFELTMAVMPLLRAAPAARVITVASEAHRLTGRATEDWQSERGYSPMQAYGRSKLANILFTAELARHVADTPITANCFHPGVVRTEFAAGVGGLLRLAFTLARPFMRSAARGASTGVYLAASRDVAGMTGLYFIDDRPARPSTAARDPALARRLWAASEQLVRTRQ